MYFDIQKADKDPFALIRINSIIATLKFGQHPEVYKTDRPHPEDPQSLLSSAGIAH
jgi:hypothetical protein